MKNMGKVLLNSSRYNGKYIAIMSAEDHTLVGAGDVPEDALNKARKKGVKNPFILYIPDKDSVHIYHAG
ncbi:MAG: DUF5678 domain-containing protein [Kiritimatiellia bacterium]|nr:DUF5678 domain-containing protein [Kiritimatiellia bacterium]